MTNAEQELMAQQQEAERQGGVAFHFGKLRAACPLAETDPFRAHWVVGWDNASKRRNRLDMAQSRATGFRAFQDGLHSHECPYPGNSREAGEWHEGWRQAEISKRKHDDDVYR